jgi:hypothetical protein
MCVEVRAAPQTITMILQPTAKIDCRTNVGFTVGGVRDGVDARSVQRKWLLAKLKRKIVCNTFHH